MKKPAFIWRKSVYQNGFCCKCGRKLLDEVTGELNRKAVCIRPTESNVLLLCMKCGRTAAFLKEIDTDADSTFGGEWKGEL